MESEYIAIMAPKGLAAVVLATIPLQQGVAGGELIKNVTYGVVLLSIVLTSLLLLLLGKTKLSDLYTWIFSPGLPKLWFLVKSPSEKLPEETGKIKPAGTKLFGGHKREN